MSKKNKHFLNFQIMGKRENIWYMRQIGHQCEIPSKQKRHKDTKINTEKKELEPVKNARL
jgi:hypothetical protein